MKLCFKGIDDIQAQKLAEALAINTSLQNLTLQNNQIGDIGTKAFAESLLKNN